MVLNFHSSHYRLILALSIHLLFFGWLVYLLLDQPPKITPSVALKMQIQSPQLSAPNSQALRSISPTPKRLQPIIPPQRSLKEIPLNAGVLVPYENDRATWTPQVTLESNNPLDNLIMDIPDLSTITDELEAPISQANAESSLFFLDISDMSGTSIYAPTFPYRDLEVPLEGLKIKVLLTVSASGVLLGFEGLETGSSTNDAIILQYLRSLKLPNSERDYELKMNLDLSWEKPQ